MAIPSSPIARLFYRAATERFEDAAALLQLNRTTGSVYLAGYSIETIANITILLLLTPEEATRSMANMEFENPVSWPLEEDGLLVAADD